MAKESIIISLGGSLVAPDKINIGFLKSFKCCLQKYIVNKQFFIIVGGGKPARNYQKALLEFGSDEVSRDWIGINVSRLNAEVVKQVFSSYSYSKIITDPNKKVKTTKGIVLGAGWKPGWSTDYVSALIAKNYKIGTIINLTNIDYVFEKNPNDFPDAKPLKQVDWKTFQGIVGDKWSPGLSMPFDPHAAKLASKLKLKVAIINGKNLERLDNFLSNKPFIGTIIE